MHLATQSIHPWLDQLDGVTVSPTEFEVLTSTQEYRERLIELIRTATKRIYLAALYLQDDEAGRAILTELYQAKQREPQLDIQVLVDFHRAQRGLIGKGPQVGNDKFYRDWAEKFAPAEIGVHGVPVKSREWSGVLHLKGFVIDDTLLYSGASINDVYLGWNERYRYDRYHVISNQALTDSMVAFMANELINDDAVVSLLELPIPTAKEMRREIRKFKLKLARTRYRFNDKVECNDGINIYPLLGLGRTSNQLNQTIVKALKSAQKRVFVCTPYFNFPAPVMSAIGKLMKQGVEVTVVVGDKTANDFFTPPDEPFSAVSALPYLYEQNLKRFAYRYQRYIDNGKLNIQLWKCDNHSYHLKGLQIDDSIYVLTGNNLNPRAWNLDLENGLLVHDKQGTLTSQFANERQCILRNTDRVSHFRDIEHNSVYPPKVAKLLKRIHRVKADLLLKRIL
ncbi:CDP-diacylglycerol--serine O-phosphatidyltransferase [Ferrimonas lipolytica]|uniref:CDP-diacylglycerol--serine O-phosphatidyltransferase n=1 Tax=Ferrimonas lipolytica TaxID=2724191 RepID=A0A6H1UFM9_9GAMM|nr:CDP-diacylglycerol--serine O-phosphatidyltransferase [Ferrimonas lipolytica]QIZ76602.1 CDP-diacylglycerol--serine O-phosphatidyltransferase [Ferrimonas lipolytica]